MVGSHVTMDHQVSPVLNHRFGAMHSARRMWEEPSRWLCHRLRGFLSDECFNKFILEENITSIGLLSARNINGNMSYYVEYSFFFGLKIMVVWEWRFWIKTSVYSANDYYTTKWGRSVARIATYLKKYLPSKALCKSKLNLQIILFGTSDGPYGC